MDCWRSLVDDDFVQRIRGFALANITPLADDIDRRDYYPVDIVKALAGEGYNSLTLDPAYGGGGRSYTLAAALFEEVAYASPAVAICLITILQAQKILDLFANQQLKDLYLPRFCEGLLSSYALTEANHGSDIRTLDTKAEWLGEEWRLDGEKSFITSGSAAELFIILAETPVGVSVFAVPRDAPGVSTYEGDNSHTFGLRNGPHVNLVLDDVRLGADHLVGEEGAGVRQAVTTLDYSRTMAAAISTGIARAAFDGALEYAGERQAFDQTVLDFQGIQWYFADALSEIDAARLAVFDAAKALDEERDIARYSSQAKLLASRVASTAASLAVQVCGAHGVTVEAPFGRYLRDAKAYEIAGGSSEILKNTIAKYLVRKLRGSNKP
jgi:alkylation response protein AidB-like acyl-CoA dehydrogenase